jgi:uncharacterized Zn finger protein (UPF0148 family)
MKSLVCEKCGSTSFKEENGYLVCAYCGVKYFNEKKADSKIDINDDVKELLLKCEKYPLKAKRFAKLILDIDPNNKEALRYLK